MQYSILFEKEYPFSRSFSENCSYAHFSASKVVFALCYCSFCKARLLTRRSPCGRDPLATALVGREDHLTQRDQPPGKQGKDQHRDQGGKFKDTPCAQRLVIKDTVQGGHKNLSEMVEKQRKTIVLACLQETEQKA